MGGKLTAGFIYNSLKNKHKSRSEKFLFYELLLALRDCANRAFRSCCIHSSNKPNLKSAKGRKFDCSNCGKKFPVIHQCYWQIMPCPNSSTVIVTSAQKCQRPREIIQELNQMGKRLRKTATHVECAIRHLAAYHTWSSTCEYTLVKSLSLVLPVEKPSMTDQLWGITRNCTQMRDLTNVTSAAKNSGDQTPWSITRHLMIRAIGPISVPTALRALKTRRTYEATKRQFTAWLCLTELVGNFSSVQIAAHTVIPQLVLNIIER